MGGVALLGSCVTRDALMLSMDVGRDATIVSRTGFASLMAPPVAGLVLPTPLGRLKLGGYAEHCVRADVEKTGLAALERQHPDVLLIDLMDERFPLFTAAGSVFCNSTEFSDSELASHPRFADGCVMDRMSSRAWELWQDGLRRFAERQRQGPLAHARLVLHRCYMATRWEPGEGAADLQARWGGAGRRSFIMQANFLLSRMHITFMEMFADALTIDVPQELWRADGAHVWGAAPYHFVRDYYVAFLAEARRQGIDLGEA